MTYMKIVNGVDYTSVEEREPCSCYGCVALEDIRLCAKLNNYPKQNHTGMCLDFSIIWITKEEEK